MNPVITFFQNNLFAWKGICIFFALVYTITAVTTGDSMWINRLGGMIAFIGLLILSVSTARHEEASPPTSKQSEDPFYIHGFLISAIGTLLWALGDILFSWPVMKLHELFFTLPA